MIGDIELLPTDIITLINKAWVNWFDEVESQKKTLKNVVCFHTIEIFLCTRKCVILWPWKILKLRKKGDWFHKLLWNQHLPKNQFISMRLVTLNKMVASQLDNKSYYSIFDLVQLKHCLETLVRGSDMNNACDEIKRKLDISHSLKEKYKK